MPANAELTANGRSSTTSSAQALAAVLVDDRTGPSDNSRSLSIELLQRATRDDYNPWLATALAASGCVRPVRLRGTVREIDPITGEVLDGLDTDDLPDKEIYVPCGDRRASVCPPCAETYRADTYQLIRAGLAGGKGMPESLAAHRWRTARPRQGPPFICLSSRVTLYSMHDVRRWLASRRTDPARVA